MSSGHASHKGAASKPNVNANGQLSSEVEDTNDQYDDRSPIGDIKTEGSTKTEATQRPNPPQANSQSQSENKTNSENISEELSEDISDNSGMRTAQINADPSISLEEARNANEGKAPNAAGSNASSTDEDYVPSSSEPEASKIPSSDKTR